MSDIPTVDDLRSDPLVHRFGDFFNPPGLTNFLGCVQSGIDLTGISNLGFPPFATGPTPNAGLVLDGRHFPSLGAPIITTWYPDKIVRAAEWAGYSIESTTVLIPGSPAVLIQTEIFNLGTSGRPLEAGLNLTPRAGRIDLWDEWLPGIGRRVEIESANGLVIARSPDGRAACVNVILPEPDRSTASTFRFDLRLEPGERWRMAFCSYLCDNPEKAVKEAREVVATADEQIERTEQFWNDELRSLFTPGNDRYSGHLPVLETGDEALRKLYWTGAAGLAYFKRESPYSAIGRTYDTLMPRYWQTLQCIWDYFLSSPAHVLLDPTVMRKSLERWMQTDLHQHFGTEYLSGSAIGPWYAINDSAMASMIHRFATWTGEFDWLKKDVEGRPVADHCLGYAEAWHALKTDSGLARFGDEYNLLECVGSYVHEVASLNAAGIDSLRRTADILGYLGRKDQAAGLRSEAGSLLASLQDLYVQDAGFWYARMPDGSLREVRHAFDLLTVLNTIPDDLTPSQKEDMADFFVRELQTPTWMRALSASDDDVLFSVRPDHQWTGAYGAWPSETAKGLCRIGRADIAAGWMRGLARSANQGPFAQAHMADGVVPLESGGAIKSSYEHPYINDWHSSSSGSWVSAVIEGLFGVRVDFEGPSAEPRLEHFDSNARLTRLQIQGKSYGVDHSGIHLE